MKVFIIALLSLASLSTFAFECSQNEAQFIGKVVEYKKERVDQNIFDCSFKIEYSRFDSSFVCPLDIDEVYTQRLVDSSCSLKDGDSISGILVQNLETGALSIE